MWKPHKSAQDICYRVNIESLEREFLYWVNHRMVSVTDTNGTEHEMFRYFSLEDTPRPESYIEVITRIFTTVGVIWICCLQDVSIGEQFPEDQARIYQEIRSACESGWDFSSRWYRDEVTRNLETG